MCGIVPKSPEELFANPLLKRNVHIISVQMLLILLKKFVRFGNYETIMWYTVWNSTRRL